MTTPTLTESGLSLFADLDAMSSKDHRSNSLGESSKPGGGSGLLGVSSRTQSQD